MHLICLSILNQGLKCLKLHWDGFTLNETSGDSFFVIVFNLTNVFDFEEKRGFSLVYCFDLLQSQIWTYRSGRVWKIVWLYSKSFWLEVLVDNRFDCKFLEIVLDGIHVRLPIILSVRWLLFFLKL